MATDTLRRQPAYRMRTWLPERSTSRFEGMTMRFQTVAVGITAILIGLFCMTELSAQDAEIQLVGSYKIEKGQRHGWLILNADIPKGHHIYALTQKDVPPPTKIKVAKSADFSVAGSFRANKKPNVIEKDPVFETRIEKHSGKVMFVAPIRINEGVELEKLSVDMKFHGQLCSDEECLPLFNKPISVSFGGYYEKPEAKKVK